MPSHPRTATLNEVNGRYYFRRMVFLKSTFQSEDYEASRVALAELPASISGIVQ